MEDDRFGDFIADLLQEDLSSSIPYPVPTEEVSQFCENVRDRFLNPYIKHYWLSINVNYSLKLKMRVIQC